jgi:uncharacterized protein YuzE
MDYDIEADILSWGITNDPIDHAMELGNFIIHLSKNKKPILIEILNASKFKGQLDKVKIDGLAKQTVETN